jgi:hypothetical protein
MKIVPDKITKDFMFYAYGNQMSEKEIRKDINYFIILLGGNVRVRILSDIIFLSFVKKYGFPTGYIPSEKLTIKYLKIKTS